MSAALWDSKDPVAWETARALLPHAIQQAGGPELVALDEWWRRAFPEAVHARVPRWVERGELVRAAEWKMRRGVFRPYNLRRLERLDEAEVRHVTARALARGVGQEEAAHADLQGLAWVGPATASAVLAALRPETAPFLDDDLYPVVMGTPLGRGRVDYRTYAERVRERARQLGEGSGTTWDARAVVDAAWAARVMLA